jgi:deoxyribose-phosphate aldolase
LRWRENARRVTFGATVATMIGFPMGHVPTDALLAHHHRADVGGGELDDMVERISGENLHALAA